MKRVAVPVSIRDVALDVANPFFTGHDSHQHQQVIFQPELIIRQSTQPSPGTSPRAETLGRRARKAVHG